MADLFRGWCGYVLLRPGTSMALLQMSGTLHDQTARDARTGAPGGAQCPPG
jgi:hypothetical protein